MHSLKESVYVCNVLYICMCLPHHAGSTPDVCRGAVTSSYQDFYGTVLSRLDVLCKVLVLVEERREERKMAYCKFV